jgi:hypothetical protein
MEEIVNRIWSQYNQRGSSRDAGEDGNITKCSCKTNVFTRWPSLQQTVDTTAAR